MLNQGIWIWKYGDFEFMHGKEYLLSREERGKIVPSFYEIPAYSYSVRFKKEYELSKSEIITVESIESACVEVDGERQNGAKEYLLPAGKHLIQICVGNKNSICALKVSGNTIYTDETWLTDSYDEVWEKAASSPLCSHLESSPQKFSLPERKLFPLSDKKADGERIIDIGEEAVVKLKLFDVHGSVNIFYGESLEETYSERCVITDSISEDSTLKERGCRYIRFCGYTDFNISIFSPYLPLEDKSRFECANYMLKKIYDMSKHTFKLCARMFFIDGVKRDRWPWAADTFLSAKTDYYSFFDADVIRRTLTMLRGNKLVKRPINNTMLFSFYWFLTMDEYYFHTGDTEFVIRNYEGMKLLLDYYLEKQDNAGFISDFGVWVFIDWHDIENHDRSCCVQMLFGKALECMSNFAQICGKEKEALYYRKLYKTVYDNINKYYWSDEKEAYISTLTSNGPTEQVRRHQNYIAILYGYADEERKNKIMRSVVFNKNIPQITTPFFKFFELELFCQNGMTREAFVEIEKYWGGMIESGATSCWEEYDPGMNGEEHYEMYGEPFDKSLCHAWGTVPIYFIGKYAAGISCTKIGYQEFEVAPFVGIGDFSGIIPVRSGYVSVKVQNQTVTVKTNVPGGSLVTQFGKIALIPGIKVEYVVK